MNRLMISLLVGGLLVAGEPALVAETSDYPQLFFRQQLQLVEPSTTQQSTVQRPAPLRLQRFSGVVFNAKGSTTLWIDDQVHWAGSERLRLRELPYGVQVLSVAGQSLKPGASFDQRGVISDPYREYLHRED